MIQFVAKLGNWVSIKNIKVEKKTDPRTVMEFLGSLTTGLDNKVEENLRKLVDLNKVDEIVKKETEKLGKNKESVEKAILISKSLKINKTITEICALPTLQTGEKKELEGFCKVYVTKKLANSVGLPIDYSGIAIPGMKRLMKKKG